jgi:cysteine dioxygenase
MNPPFQALMELDQYTSRIPLAVLQDWLARTEITLGGVRPFLRFSPDHYVRNLMYAGPSYQALVLCWQSGQRSPIHDHARSSCAVKVVQGVATETTFARADNGMLYATGSRRLAAGASCASQDDDVHQMSNLQPDGLELITLHIYSPALVSMNMYSIVDAQSHTLLRCNQRRICQRRGHLTRGANDARDVYANAIARRELVGQPRQPGRWPSRGPGGDARGGDRKAEGRDSLSAGAVPLHRRDLPAHRDQRR